MHEPAGHYRIQCETCLRERGQTRAIKGSAHRAPPWGTTTSVKLPGKDARDIFVSSIFRNVGSKRGPIWNAVCILVHPWTTFVQTSSVPLMRRERFCSWSRHRAAEQSSEDGTKILQIAVYRGTGWTEFNWRANDMVRGRAKAKRRGQRQHRLTVDSFCKREFSVFVASTVVF